ncbi:hypothetical protein SAMN03159496_04596 [Rhizobium sp. NFR07]|uniref:hypothetical protein n=1 Tax=Rhizobium sp. NFR07 TaxID=1566262 RepID=UPI0008EDEF9F|nr:hypothetical protein [Rhizobium sp. NFR07]SFB52061.1 hypothetical protein SAMN03159496_04596 [Rhizobium sp. NFR07]
MTSMIERAARAIATEDGKNPDELSHNSFQWWRHYVPHARAALEAMREPSTALHEAANEISVYFDDFSCGDGNITLGVDGYPDKFNRVWSGLIDAALKEATT